MQKKYSAKQMAAAFLCGSLFFSGLSFAAAQTVDVRFDKLKLFVDGANKSAADGQYDNNGTKVPATLSYQDTTYIPVRMIGNLLGKEVDWNASCKAILIGSKPAEETMKAACAQVDLSAKKLLFLDNSALSAIRDKYWAGNPDIVASVDQLLQTAEQEMKSGPYSVMYKTSMPDSGDKHDYVSIGIYWWPNPDTATGKPYIRKDGFVNPESRDATFDKDSFVKVNSAIRTLALAYYYTGEERYAEYGAKLLKTWYLDPETKMNPNLNFGQSVPGVNNGRPEGIIETINLMNTLDYSLILNTSKYFGDADLAAFRSWVGEFNKWLMESEIGLGEKKAKNNHGTWYDAQVAAYAIFSGQTDTAKKVIEESKKRVDAQIEPDGKMPLEMSRTRSLHYPLYNLQGFINLAVLGDQVGVDLWSYETKDGRSIRKTLDFLTPYYKGDKKWELDQAIEENMSEAIPVLIPAAAKYNDKLYKETAAKLLQDKKGARESLLYNVPAQ